MYKGDEACRCGNTIHNAILRLTYRLDTCKFEMACLGCEPYPDNVAKDKGKIKL